MHEAKYKNKKYKDLDFGWHHGQPDAEYMISMIFFFDPDTKLLGLDFPDTHLYPVKYRHNYLKLHSYSSIPQAWMWEVIQTKFDFLKEDVEKYTTLYWEFLYQIDALYKAILLHYENYDDFPPFVAEWIWDWFIWGKDNPFPWYIPDLIKMTMEKLEILKQEMNPSQVKIFEIFTEQRKYGYINIEDFNLSREPGILPHGYPRGAKHFELD